MRGLLQEAAGLSSHADRAEEVGCRRVAASRGRSRGRAGREGGRAVPLEPGGGGSRGYLRGGRGTARVEPGPALCPPAPDGRSAGFRLAAELWLRAAAGREPGSPWHCWESGRVLLARWRRSCHLHRLGPFTTLWGLCRSARASCSPSPRRG